MSINALQLMEIEELQASQERFRVTDLNGANWCLRKLAALKAKEAEVNQLADAEVERINAWRDKELAKVKESTDYLEMLLMEYHQEQLKLNPKAKTITTPYGKLKSMTRQPSPKKADDEALLRFLEENGETEYIKVKKSPDWAAYKQTLRIVEADGDYFVVDENGQPVEGVEIDFGGTSFSVEVAE
ncbi:phage protein [Alicyclobacillus contaminans]|uniref:host-nuclease inhibitor Gam family protein n=1 Tax=Alicyclobacillus contaminans TaxID=392016 RepID=UPI00041DBC89|nr:host-nuclease inhibitor Gam family protein [Alicyclobacillus contaminans]GMA50171.1 phage protein [Alicyclobacillus contaminans]